jgi:hypothetical protein
MPFSLRRPSSSNPKVKEWKNHNPGGGAYFEVIKYKTRERAQQAATEWGGNAEVVEVQWTAGQDENTYPDY